MKALATFEKILKYICCVLLWAITVVVFAQVIARYVFKSAFSWTDEFAIYGMVWMVMLGASINSFRGTHARIDFFISWLPNKARFVVEILDQLICAGVMSAVIYYSNALVAKNAHNLSAGLRVPLSVLYSAVIFGGALIVIMFVIKAVLYTIQLAKGEKFEC